MFATERSVFGALKDGRLVEKIVLRNASGMSASFITLGASLISVMCPDKHGAVEEVTLNYSTLDDYVAKSRFYGVTTGRVANRIMGGKFTLDGTTYQLAKNNMGRNALHGGVVGFDKVMWSARVTSGADFAGVEFKYLSHDGEEGYPGNVNVTAEYRLLASNAISMTFTAETDAPTIVNLVNHAYWNLSGNLTRDIKEQHLTLYTPYFLPADEFLIPTGETRSVVGTPFDFLEKRAIGSRLMEVDGGGKPGYDHCMARMEAGPGYVEATEPTPIAKVEDPLSGRTMVVSTTQPAVHLYTSNFLSGAPPHAQHYALCLETQHFPDGVNQPLFPSIVLRPGETYRQVTVHSFSW